MKEPKRHHFVPRMLLRNFTDEKGQLYFFDERSEEKCVRPIGLDNFCVEKNLYTCRDECGNEDVSAEEDFSELEGQTAGIIKKIISAARDGKLPELTPSEKETLDRFLLCQWSRVPDASDPILARSFRSICVENPEILNVPEKEQERFRREMRVKSLTHNVRNPSKKILSVFENKGLAVGIANASDQSLVIGSNPVLADPPGYFLFGRIRKDWLPIAPDIAIASYFPRGFEGFVELDVGSFNQAVFRQSSAIAGNSKELIGSVVGA